MAYSDSQKLDELLEGILSPVVFSGARDSARAEKEETLFGDRKETWYDFHIEPQSGKTNSIFTLFRKRIKVRFGNRRLSMKFKIGSP